MAGSMILDVVYAFDARPGDSRIELVEKAVHTVTNLINAGVYLVDIFPISGSDTTIIALTTFIFATVIHPEAQAFVQEELDRVVGRHRLPGIDDRQSLPRVTAVIRRSCGANKGIHLSL
ncbi:uncharacterized protein PHACADRAFT_209387 [Phanerochaete carnosa HHB-10118-sp]|uniref:Cytochrome P450 n=1 Tax=Phanerochaete carnosa (strain HHB-10118-sp) TaxID=650164 RepID=K5W9L2_PHACS|nr:uncharacterized protein PHACADRAFT_209387 [Phanerochaete carnosa HHB-10118-sp]EKM55875.1 hypothetical protein PHACADRAFT_209387 [Phanerochaete carnosa HHB-10118-sp]